MPPRSKPQTDPNSDTAEREHWRQQADRLARLLDSMVRVPGTDLTIGLDPLLGLIPGVGDVISHCLGSLLLFLAAQLRVPRIVMVRMTLNIGINTIVGSVPVFGDLFSVWFRSNVRNAQILRRYSQPGHDRSTAQDWTFVIALALATLVFFAAIALALLWLAVKLVRSWEPSYQILT